MMLRAELPVHTTSTRRRPGLLSLGLLPVVPVLVESFMAGEMSGGLSGGMPGDLSEQKLSGL
jgi:hypothetical protein